MPIIRIPIKGGMTIPNTMSLDPGTYRFCHNYLICVDDIHTYSDSTLLDLIGKANFSCPTGTRCVLGSLPSL